MNDIKVTVNLNVTADEVVTERTLKNGDVFPVMLVLEHGGNSKDPIVFDTMVLEIVFNDGDDVLVRVDPNDRPVAGQIANNSDTTVDVFSGVPVKAGSVQDDPPFSSGSRLSLQGNGSQEPVGPYRGRTGRAGFRDLESPFVLRPGDSPLGFAMGKATGGLTAARPGVTTITATGYALRSGQMIPISPVAGTVTVSP